MAVGFAQGLAHRLRRPELADNDITTLPPVTVTPPAEPVYGYRQPQDLSDSYNAFRFLFRQMTAEINTSIPCRVESVNADKTVNIVIMINQLLADKTASEHGIIYNVPYYQLQAGTFGIIAKPVVGDIGIALFSSRDITALKKVAQAAQPTQPVNPGSLRRFDFSDVLYLGGVFNRDPESYIEGTDTTIDIVSDTVSTTAQVIEQTGELTALGNESHTGRIDISGSLYVNGDEVSPGGATPYFIPSGKTFTVPENCQTIAEIPCKIDGALKINGYWFSK